MTNNWETKKLGDLLQRTETINPTLKPEQEFNYIDVSSVSNKTFEIESVNVIKGKDAPSRARKLIKTGDIIFATVRPTLRRISIIPEEYNNQVCSTGYFVLRAKENVCNSLIFYYLLTDSFNERMEKLQKGASYPAVTDGEVREQIIHYPTSLTEQQRIVAILDEAFAAIAQAKENAEKNLQNARELFDSYLQSVFANPGGGWEEKTLGEVCEELFAGGDVPKDNSSKFRTDDFNIPIFSNGEKNKGLYGYTNVARVTKPSITVSARGTIGYSEIREESFYPAIRLIVVTPKKDVLNLAFLKYVIGDIDFKHSGTSIPQLTVPMIRNYPISFPSLELQQNIVSKLDALSEEIQKLENIYRQKINDLDELKKSILQKAFSGELTAKRQGSNVIDFPVRIPNISATDLQAGIVALAFQQHQEKGKVLTFGHVKAEKIVHLAQEVLNIELEREPVKDAAGPNDFPRLKKVESRAEKAGFFRTIKQGFGYSYIPGNQFNNLIEKTKTVLNDKADELTDLIDLLVPMDTQQAELVATVYAAWNNLLIDNLTITDEAIVSEARENWHEAKLKIERERFFKTISWMKQNNLIPDGKGKKVSVRPKK
jgi:type I restriction enzyme S subunit